MKTLSNEFKSKLKKTEEEKDLAALKFDKDQALL
jgi:hypothetical protein